MKCIGAHGSSLPGIGLPPVAFNRAAIWILFHFRLRKCRDRGFDERSQVIPVIHIADVEIVLGAIVRWPKDDFFQEGTSRLRHFNIEVIVANKAKENTVAIGAIVSHHLLHGNLTSARALVDDVLNEVHLLTVFTVEPKGEHRIGKVYAIRPFIDQLLT